MSIDVKYTAIATATGGRDGRAESSDGHLSVQLSLPKELGGPGGDGTNPEQLFACGYAACFIGAMRNAARDLHLTVPAAVTVEAHIGIGPRSEGGFGITAELRIDLGGMPREDAETLIAKAHQICPYSNATRGNVDVILTLV